jgi:hypothetical protein
MTTMITRRGVSRAGMNPTAAGMVRTTHERTWQRMAMPGMGTLLVVT